MSASPAAPALELLDDALLTAVSKEFEVESTLLVAPCARTFRVRARGGDGPPLVVHAVRRDAVERMGTQEALLRVLRQWPRLTHRRIVPLLQCDVTPDWIWGVCVEPPGESLAARLRRQGPLGVDAMVRLAEDVGAAVDAAHRAGLHHGALRPSCLHLDGQGQASVGSFGFERARDLLAGRPVAEWSASGDRVAFAQTLIACLEGRTGPTTGAGQAPNVPEQVWTVLRDAQDDGMVAFRDLVDLAAALRAAARAPSRLTPRMGDPPLLLVEPAPIVPRLWRFAAVAALVLAIGAIPWARLGDRRAPVPPGSTWSAAAWSRPGPAVVPPAVASPPPPTAPPEPRSSSGSTQITGARETAETPPPVRRPPRMQPRTVAPPSGPSEASAPTEPGPIAAVANGELSISSRPWGEVSLNGQMIGSTPVLAFKLPPGVHQIRIERAGFRAFTREIRILPGTPMRLSDIVLEPEVP